MSNPNICSKIALVLRWVVSITLLVLVFRSVDLHALRVMLGQTNLWLLSIAIMMLIADRFFFGIRWKLILQPYTDRVSTSTLIRITFISTFLANFLPSALSADLVRGYFLHKEKEKMEAVVSSVFLDRAVGFISQLLLALVALAGAYFGGYLPEDWLSIVVLLSGVTVIAVGIMATPWAGAVVNRLQTSNWSVVRKIGRVVKSVRDYPWSLSRLIKVLGFACLVYVSAIYASYLVFQAVGGELPFPFFFLFVLIVQIAITIPVSIGGFGVHEGAWVVVMGNVGVPASEAFLFAILLHTISLFISLPGGVLYAIHRPKITEWQETRSEGRSSVPPEIKEEVVEYSKGG